MLQIQILLGLAQKMILRWDDFPERWPAKNHQRHNIPSHISTAVQWNKVKLFNGSLAVTKAQSKASETSIYEKSISDNL
ncbi:hypothetical protein V2J09_017525 [Rumex salicifolius]